MRSYNNKIMTTQVVAVTFDPNGDLSTPAAGAVTFPEQFTNAPDVTVVKTFRANGVWGVHTITVGVSETTCNLEITGCTQLANQTVDVPIIAHEQM
jgi:hypothetical protein